MDKESILHSRARTEPAETLPKSATSGVMVCLAFLAFAIACVTIFHFEAFGEVTHAAIFLVSFPAAVIFFVDVAFYKVHRNPSTGLDWSSWHPSASRTCIKFIGFSFTLLCVGAVYWAFPLYHDNFYARYFDILELTIPIFVLLSVPYIWFVDGHMRDPHDALWQVGSIVIGNFRNTKKDLLPNYARGWLVKGFFLPLMLVFMMGDIQSSRTLVTSGPITSRQIYEFFYWFFYLVDVTFAALGYVFSLRLFDTHMRSTEPTMFGWLVAIVCYPPFWNLISNEYVRYDSGHPWGEWLWNNPILYGLWGTCILILVAIYASATIIFGGRFSNLTHRGIITNGPYRYSKHPAYISKNLSWWLISVPFLVHGGDVLETVRLCALLGMVNLIYYWRAKTEERHLMWDPVYRRYAAWVDGNGIFARIRNAVRPIYSWM